MYIVSTNCYIDGYTNYVVKTLDDVADLLLNEEFLDEYDLLFDEGITGFRYGERKSRDLPIEIVVQYWNGDYYEETSLYLYEIKIIGEDL